MRFVVLGDLHYSRYSSASVRQMQDEYFERLFNRVLEQQADLVIAIGDTVDNGYLDEFEGLHTCARRVGLRFLTVNGNHDLLNLTKAEIACWTGNTQPYFSFRYDPQYNLSSVFNPTAASFVILDTPKEKSPKEHSGFVGQAQLTWLKEEIAISGSSPLFIFAHHPLKGTTRYSSFPMLNIENSSAVKLALLGKREGTALYFCGHNHANNITQRANWNFVQTAAPLRTNNFRVVDFTPAMIDIQTVAVQGARQQYLASQMLRAMGDFLRLPAKGQWRDQALQLATGNAVAEKAALLQV